MKYKEEPDYEYLMEVMRSSKVTAKGLRVAFALACLEMPDDKDILKFTGMTAGNLASGYECLREGGF